MAGYLAGYLAGLIYVVSTAEEHKVLKLQTVGCSIIAANCGCRLLSAYHSLFVKLSGKWKLLNFEIQLRFFYCKF